MLKKIAGDLFQLKRDLPALLVWSRRLRHDPNFDLANVDRGLEPRPPTVLPDAQQRLQIAHRVLVAYEKAAVELQRRSPLYRVSNEWVPIFNKPLRPLLQALAARDPRQLRDLLDNFYRSSISAGLCGLATDMESAFFRSPPSGYRRRQLLVDTLYRYRLLRELMPDVSAAALAVPDVGNPYGLYIDGAFVRNGADYQYYYARRVAQLIGAPSRRASALELGGGVGGFAYFLNTIGPTPLTYINIDLPEILCISAYQLLNLFPERKFLLYGECDSVNSTVLAGHDIALLPSFEIESLDEDSVDVAFNSYSLAEMAPASIENYVGHLSRVTRQAILHVNHVCEAVVGADDFPFDVSKFELQSRVRARWNMGRYLRSDEYEFVLRRRTAAGPGDRAGAIPGP